MLRKSNHRIATDAPMRGKMMTLRAIRLGAAAIAVLLALLAKRPVSAQDWLAERRQEVEQMSPTEKQELQEKYEKFLSLSPDEQKQLRVLYRKLDNDPDGERLRRVMQRYYDWLKTLTQRDRDDLLRLKVADRPARIKLLQQQQEARAAMLSGGSHLTPEDVGVLSVWVKKYATAHEAELKEMLPPRHGEHPANDKSPHERMGQFGAWRPWLGAKLPKVSKEEIEDLTQRLSAEPRKEIENRPTSADKIEIIHGWLQAIWRQRVAGGGHRFGHRGPNVNPKELARFFNDLPKEKQTELTKLPEEEQHRELRRLYFQQRRANESPTSSGGDTGHHDHRSDMDFPKTAKPSPPANPSPAEKQPPAVPDAAAKTPEATKG